MTVVQGSILAIPLLKELGFAYAKYINLKKIRKDVVFPDILKVFNYTNDSMTNDVSVITRSGYLLSPMAIAGLRPTLKMGYWYNIGQLTLDEVDNDIPSFKSGNSTLEEIEKGQWFLHKEAKVSKPIRCEYEQVKFLQPFAAFSSQSIELLLTMYHIQKRGLQVADFFDLSDEQNFWHHKHVLDSPPFD